MRLQKHIWVSTASCTPLELILHSTLLSRRDLRTNLPSIHLIFTVLLLIASAADTIMAELLGLVASVIQVAGSGIQLSKTLYGYVDRVATADRRIKDIATEIEMTSIVIEELGDVFKREETASLVFKKAVKTANDTIT